MDIQKMNFDILVADIERLRVSNSRISRHYLDSIDAAIKSLTNIGLLKESQKIELLNSLEVLYHV